MGDEPAGFHIPAWLGAKLALFLGFGGILAILILAGNDSLRAVSELETRNAESGRAYLARRQTLQVVRSGIYLSGTYVRDYLLEADPVIAADSREQLTRLHADMDAALRVPERALSAEELRLFGELREELAVYWATLDPILLWSHQQRSSSGFAFLQAEILPRRTALLRTADKLSRLDELAWSNGNRQAAELYAGLRRRILLILAIGVVASILMAGITIRRLLELERAGAARYAEAEGARAQLRQLSARLVEVQEQERRSIARELHDEVGQSLSAMLVDLGNLAAVVPSESSDARRRLTGIRELAERTLREVRDLALLLRPSMLDDLGLGPALEWQAREVSRRSGMAVEVSLRGLEEDDLPEEAKTCIYRLVQEALHNCFRHSGARRVQVRLARTEGRLALAVEDDGHGFDPRQARGLGLTGMEERVRYLGGSFRVDAQPGRGTRLHAELPLAGRSAAPGAVA